MKNATVLVERSHLNVLGTDGAVTVEASLLATTAMDWTRPVPRIDRAHVGIVLANLFRIVTAGTKS